MTRFGANLKPRHRLLLLVIPILLLSGTALAAGPVISQDQALALLRDGRRQDALKALEAIIASHPADPGTALFTAGTIELEDGRYHDAELYAQQLVKLRPSSFAAWELMIQVEQAAGNMLDRDVAIRSLYDCWHAALDPQTQSRIAFVRDRVVGPKHTLIAQQTLDPGGDTILRFVFQPAEEMPPHHLILVQSDGETNERWREDGTVPYGTVVYHLDTVEALGGGREAVRPYAYYLEPPDYDRVRAQVAGILAGTVQPLSGAADPFWAGVAR